MENVLLFTYPKLRDYRVVKNELFSADEKYQIHINFTLCVETATTENNCSILWRNVLNTGAAQIIGKQLGFFILFYIDWKNKV